MFDMNRIGKAIRTARIEKNMTQMELADQMGVSFQAVSNWERGSSMPDIAKLETLSQILDLDIHLLLGGQSQASMAVEKVLTEPEAVLSVKELAEVAPILSPDQVHAEVNKATQDGGAKTTLKDISPLLPFLDEDMTDEIIGNIHYDSLAELACAAPFLSESQLDALVCKADTSDWEGILALAPFLSGDTLDSLAERCMERVDAHKLTQLAPFLSEQTLSRIAEKMGDIDLHTLVGLAPFLEEVTLDRIVKRELDKGCSIQALTPLYPFLSSETMRRLMQHFLRTGDIEGMKAAATFL